MIDPDYGSQRFWQAFESSIDYARCVARAPWRYPPHPEEEPPWQDGPSEAELEDAFDAWLDRFLASSLMVPEADPSDPAGYRPRGEWADGTCPHGLPYAEGDVTGLPWHLDGQQAWPCGRPGRPMGVEGDVEGARRVRAEALAAYARAA